MLLLKFIVLVFCVFLGYFLGYLFTETRYRIARFKVFDFEAFRCRQCLSFHISWVLSSMMSMLFEDWVMLGVGVAFSFALYLGLKIDQKRKTIEL